MVEGIEHKEPNSPRMTDGEYIEEECKFLPPPKTILPPRLFMIRPDHQNAIEFMNESQLNYFFRVKHADHSILQTRTNITVDNEQAMTHMFLVKQKAFDAHKGLRTVKWPTLPRSLE